MFNPSITELIRFIPWRYTTQPTYAPDGTELTPGVKENMPNVLVRLDEALLAELRALLTTTTQRTQFDGWTRRMTDVECAEWHVPVWSGETSATFLAIPNAIWSRWDAAVPAIVKTRFGRLYKDA